MTTKINLVDRQEALDELRARLPVGCTVTTVLTHVSASGMTRTIRVFDPNMAEITHLIARTGLFGRDPKHNGLRVGGVGMDMGFHVVYELSRLLYPDGFTCTGHNYRPTELRAILPEAKTVRLYVGWGDESPHTSTFKVPMATARMLADILGPYRCPSNDHMNDHKIPYNQTVHHRDGGYALQHRWL